MSALEQDTGEAHPDEDFKPTGTVFLVVAFVAMLILLWASVYVILISRGVTG
ncbi:MAG: cytochrome c oxidase subunit 2A [Acidimicrobiales bacterium]|nr:cytochrome c oxidase subunit 2A [Acidimicrobiales bacterium]